MSRVAKLKRINSLLNGEAQQPQIIKMIRRVIGAGGVEVGRYEKMFSISPDGKKTIIQNYESKKD
jgi:hypothetical protein